jgi:hypothetical protein
MRGSAPGLARCWAPTPAKGRLKPWRFATRDLSRCRRIRDARSGKSAIQPVPAFDTGAFAGRSRHPAPDSRTRGVANLGRPVEPARSRTPPCGRQLAGLDPGGLTLSRYNQIKLTPSHSIMHLIEVRILLEQAGYQHGKNHRNRPRHH